MVSRIFLNISGYISIDREFLLLPGLVIEVVKTACTCLGMAAGGDRAF